MSSSIISNASNIHYRNVEHDESTKTARLPKKENIAATGAPTTEDDEMEPLPSQPNGARILTEPSLAQNYMQYVDRSLDGLPPRWRNWIIRGIFSFIML